jgi:hypothetical protein
MHTSNERLIEVFRTARVLAYEIPARISDYRRLRDELTEAVRVTDQYAGDVPNSEVLERAAQGIRADVERARTRLRAFDPAIQWLAAVAVLELPELAGKLAHSDAGGPWRPDDASIDWDGAARDWRTIRDAARLKLEGGKIPSESDRPAGGIVEGEAHRGRLPKDEAEARRTAMLATVRKHPSLKDDPERLGPMVGVSVSSIRRWLAEEERKFQESVGARDEED